MYTFTLSVINYFFIDEQLSMIMVLYISLAGALQRNYFLYNYENLYSPEKKLVAEILN